MLVQVTGNFGGKPFCAGVVFEKDHVVFAAPILAKTVGWHRKHFADYFRSRYCRVEVVW